MFIKPIILLITVGCTISSPVPDKKDRETDAKVLYDQRQEGEWNVRAHLDNFIIMIVPTQAAPSTSSPNLLDFLMKSFPKGSYLKRVKHVKKQKPDPVVEEETMHFIESKTAPYHVDLTKSNTDIIKSKEDVVLTSSPSITVVKPELDTHKRASRVARHYILTLPTDDEFVVSRHVEPKSAIRKHKKTIKEKTKQELKLLGAENEQCGPGMVRDSYGICQVLKH